MNVDTSLEIRALRKSYRQGAVRLEILKGLSGKVAKGEVVAILGQSGSGKSTLLSLLAGLDRPDQGAILVGGADIAGLSEAEMTAFRAENIGIVFQQFHLLPHLTALENVMVPLEIAGHPEAEKLAREMLQQMGLSDRVQHLPAKLSGGECQRVAIARALVTKPKILLADEPSGNLDVETGKTVMDVFFDVIKKNSISTILVTHSPELAARCDRQLILKNGVL